MTETYLDRLAYYDGVNRSWLMRRDHKYKIIAQKTDNFGDVTHVQFDNGEWVGIGSIQLVDSRGFADNNQGLTDIDETFSAAAGGPREMISNEIHRLELRLIELRSALKVIDSL